MKWSDKDIETLKRLYPNMQSIEVAKIMDCSIDRIYNKAFSLRLKKSPEYLESENSGRLTGKDTRGIRSRFPKGHTPFNKNKSWKDYMPEENRVKSLQTTFKAGHLPHNAKSDGEISIRNDEGRKYKYIRLSLAKWVPLHVYLWESLNGPVPAGMIVVFKDRDSMNCDILNLELITREENMRRNTYQRYPEDVRKLIQLKGVLNRQIRKQNEYRSNID